MSKSKDAGKKGTRDKSEVDTWAMLNALIKSNAELQQQVQSLTNLQHEQKKRKDKVLLLSSFVLVVMFLDNICLVVAGRD